MLDAPPVSIRNACLAEYVTCASPGIRSADRRSAKEPLEERHEGHHLVGICTDRSLFERRKGFGLRRCRWKMLRSARVESRAARCNPIETRAASASPARPVRCRTMQAPVAGSVPNLTMEHDARGASFGRPFLLRSPAKPTEVLSLQFGGWDDAARRTVAAKIASLPFWSPN
jgi:hypothetical protein